MSNNIEVAKPITTQMPTPNNSACVKPFSPLLQCGTRSDYTLNINLEKANVPKDVKDVFEKTLPSKNCGIDYKDVSFSKSYPGYQPKTYNFFTEKIQEKEKSVIDPVVIPIIIPYQK